MPNLEHELEQLAAADRHIERAEFFVAQLRNARQVQHARGLNVAAAEDTLQAAVQTLDVFLLHRRLIREIIDDLRAGRLPGD
ncbi:MAG TPA: hypothetical protein VF522_12435 [Ramlibacter sp.]|uniref:hypothetical protein n=1 Tax=Ramlibacter sp. TaxID=1917967 RepID=UPI002ED311E8